MEISNLKSGIYIIKNLVDDKIYVGSTNNFRVRWQRHIRDLDLGIHAGSKLQRAWIKYGKDNFEFAVIEYVDNLELLLIREQYWLDCLCAVKFGYNVLPTAGSNVGHKLSEAHKAALSFKGKRHSEESKLKMSLAAKNRIVSDETRSKLSVARSGKKMSEETKAKMRVIGTGRKHSKETCEKMSQQRKGISIQAHYNIADDWYEKFMSQFNQKV